MKALTPNMEMYLKTILEIVTGGKRPRVKEIADRLQVRMPSVTGAIESLQRQGMVKHDPYGDVTLTTRGKRLAERVVQSHGVIRRFLEDVLKLPAKTAEDDACVLEHVISSITLERLAAFLEFLEVRQGDASERAEQFAEWLGCAEMGHGGTRGADDTPGKT